jgi:hypothetical protein
MVRALSRGFPVAGSGVQGNHADDDVEIPVWVEVIPTPPRDRRLLWDQVLDLAGRGGGKGKGIVACSPRRTHLFPTRTRVLVCISGTPIRPRAVPQLGLSAGLLPTR